ncbi:fucolectin-4-like [Osmerus eperlanus]|uniref:fucolectin-4-like n=2 Tax=Osmerus eperlanus TaxID=29151 RepID=UPI002E0E4DC8
MAIHKVSYITITNREDCCVWRLDGAQILVGNSLQNNGNNNPVCVAISSIPAGDSVTFQCNGMEGRYVNIIRPGCFKILSVCEVEVYGEFFKEALTDTQQESSESQMINHECMQACETQCPVENIPQNLASAGSATQSSEYDNLGGASNAIDRKRDPRYHSGSCSHTKAETNPWWRLDLLGIYNVSSVSITNRGDCCHTRITGAEIRIGNHLDGVKSLLCAVIPEMKEGEVREFACGEMEGRYVTVVLPGKEKYLSLCEVEVHGGPRKE